MTRIKHTVCPWCMKRHDRVSGIAKKGTKTEPVATNGDATLCVGCGEMSIFDDTVKGGLRFPTEAENEELLESKLVGMVRWSYRAVPNQFHRPILHYPQWMKRST